MVRLLVGEESLEDEGARGPGHGRDAAAPLLLLFFLILGFERWGGKRKKNKVGRLLRSMGIGNAIEPLHFFFSFSLSVNLSISLSSSHHAVRSVADRSHVAVEAGGRGDRGEEGDAREGDDDDGCDESDVAAAAREERKGRRGSSSGALSPPLAGCDRHGARRKLALAIVEEEKKTVERAAARLRVPEVERSLLFLFFSTQK